MKKMTKWELWDFIITVALIVLLATNISMRWVKPAVIINQTATHVTKRYVRVKTERKDIDVECVPYKDTLDAKKPE